MEKITEAQQRVLEFIQARINQRGNAPTLREICAHMGYAAIGSAQDVISALRKKGFLREPDKQSARSFSLTDKARALASDFLSVPSADAIEIPCLGAVPAGHPLEAVENRVGMMSISLSLLGSPRPRPQTLFGLRATGLSMIGAGIIDGDWLIVKSQSEAQNGEIVVARVEGDATVKRLIQDQVRGWVLRPENPAFKPIYADETSFEVIGRVLALQRSF